MEPRFSTHFGRLLGALWELLGALRGPSWRPLGRLWGPVGAFREPLGAFWAPLGCFGAPLGALLELFGSPLGIFWVYFAPGTLFETFRGRFGVPLLTLMYFVKPRSSLWVFCLRFGIKFHS